MAKNSWILISTYPYSGSVQLSNKRLLLLSSFLNFFVVLFVPIAKAGFFYFFLARVAIGCCTTFLERWWIAGYLGNVLLFSGGFWIAGFCGSWNHGSLYTENNSVMNNFASFERVRWRSSHTIHEKWAKSILIIMIMDSCDYTID